jgi:hypothetical protein
VKVNITLSAAGTRTNTVTVSTPGETVSSNNTSAVDTVTVAAGASDLTASRAGTGTGTITSSPAGITCGSDCSESYTTVTAVTLTATADAGSTFTGWSGACTGTGTCQVTVDAAQRVMATFTRPASSIQLGRGPSQPATGAPTLVAHLSARSGCGSIQTVTFGNAGRPFNNAVVSITSPAEGPVDQDTAFSYTPPSGTTEIALSIRRVVQDGGATVSPIVLTDGCAGQWRTFVGGGPDAFR